MATVTKVTWEEYVAVVTCGGKAFGFHGHGSPSATEEHAKKCLIEYDSFDRMPDDYYGHWVYYVLTE